MVDLVQQGSKMKPVIYKNVKRGLYLIDEYGNIYSNYKKDFLIPNKDKDGYLKIKLSGGSKNNHCYTRIATLVGYHFLGKPPQNLKDPTINHIDGNITNNYYKNLEWIERGTNSSIRNNKGEGETNHEAKLTTKQVQEICDLLLKTDLTYEQIASKYNTKKNTIADIKNHKTWKTITKQYDFSCRQLIRENGKFKTVNLNLGHTGE